MKGKFGRIFWTNVKIWRYDTKKGSEKGRQRSK